MLSKYFIKLNAVHPESSREFEFLSLPQYLTFHLDYGTSSNIESIKSKLEVSEEVITKHLASLIPEKVCLNRVFVLSTTEPSEMGSVLENKSISLSKNLDNTEENKEVQASQRSVRATSNASSYHSQFSSSLSGSRQRK